MFIMHWHGWYTHSFREKKFFGQLPGIVVPPWHEMYMARPAKLKCMRDLKISALSQLQTTQVKHIACVLAARDCVLVARHSSLRISASRCHVNLKKGGRSMHLSFLCRSCHFFLFLFYACGRGSVFSSENQQDYEGVDGAVIERTSLPTIS